MSTTNMIAEPASVHGSPHTIGKAEAAAQTVRSRIIAAPSLDAPYTVPRSRSASMARMR